MRTDMTFDQARIAVTGATGFVMANLVAELAHEGHRVAAADIRPPERELSAWLGPATTFSSVDVADRAAVGAFIRETSPSHAVLGAAITAVSADEERRRAVDAVAVNVLGVLHALDALRVSGCRRVVLVSSSSAYGPRTDAHALDEDEECRPSGIYGVTKRSAELLALRFAEMHGIDLVVARLAAPFGPFDRDTGARQRSALADWVTAIAAGRPLAVYGALGPRDLIYVADVASALSALLRADRLPARIYNIGWGQLSGTGEVLEALRRAAPGSAVPPTPDIPPALPPRGPLDSARLRRDTGWAPAYTLETGLRTYLAWARAATKTPVA